MHGCLEATEARTIGGEVVAAVDEVGRIEEAVSLARTDEGHIAECGCGEGRGGATAGIVVTLETIALALVGNAAIANREAVLHVARVAIVCIEVIVPTLVGDEVFGINVASKPFEAVVVGVGNLHVVHLRGATYGTEGDTVDFLVGLEGIACKFHAYITQHTRVVGSVLAAVLGARAAFDLRLASIVGCTAAEDESAPVAGFALPLGLARGEDDGRLGCALGNEFTATLYDECRLGLLVAADNRSWLNGQFGAFGHIDPAFQIIGATFERLTTREDELLVAVADDVAFEEQVVGCFQSAVGCPMTLFGLGGFVVVTTCRKSERQHQCQRCGGHPGGKK